MGATKINEGSVQGRDKLWIVKPCQRSCGAGIRVLSSKRVQAEGAKLWKKGKNGEVVVQRYIEASTADKRFQIRHAAVCACHIL